MELERFGGAGTGVGEGALAAGFGLIAVAGFGRGTGEGEDKDGLSSFGVVFRRDCEADLDGDLSANSEPAFIAATGTLNGSLSDNALSFATGVISARLMACTTADKGVLSACICVDLISGEACLPGAEQNSAWLFCITEETGTRGSNDLEPRGSS